MTEYGTYIRTRCGMNGHMNNWSPHTAGTVYPLVLTSPNGPDVIPWDASSIDKIRPAAQVIYHQTYRNMKRDLLALSHVCRQFMYEYRSYQRVRFEPSVQLGEFATFVNIFYPSQDAAIAANYRGNRITIGLPYYNKAMYDIVPILQFFNRASHIQCNVLTAHQFRPGVCDSQQCISGPTNTLRSYMANPPAGSPRIVKANFRARGRYRTWPWGLAQLPADRTFEGAIHFEFDRASKQDWMDGVERCYKRDTANRYNLRQSIVRRRKEAALQFLMDAGIDSPDMLYRWQFKFSAR